MTEQMELALPFSSLLLDTASSILAKLSSLRNPNPCTPNQVNISHWTTKANKQNIHSFCMFPAHGQICLKWPQMRPGRSFPTNPDLADILGNTDFDFDNFILLDLFGSKIPRFPGSWIYRFPDSQAGGGGATARSRRQPPQDQIWEIQGTTPRP